MDGARLIGRDGLSLGVSGGQLLRLVSIESSGRVSEIAVYATVECASQCRNQERVSSPLEMDGFKYWDTK